MVEQIQSKRKLSIDLFRSLAIAGMVLVNNNGGAGAYAQLRHSAWHGVTFADFVFPFFLWIAGLSMVLATDGRLRRGQSRWAVFRHAASRGLFIAFIGLLLSGFPRFDVAHWRWMGVLQRIGICLIPTAALHVYGNKWLRGGVLVGCLAGYTALVHPGGYEQGTTLANRVDAKVLGEHNSAALKTWDTEGLLGTMPALGTCLLGAMAGRRMGKAGVQRWLVGSGGALLAVGLMLSPWQPLNKPLWTPTYVLVTGGTAALVLAGLSAVFDGKGRRHAWVWPWQLLGQHALVVYVFHDYFAESLRRVTVGGETLDARLRTVWAGVGSVPNARLGYACSHLAAAMVAAWAVHHLGTGRRDWGKAPSTTRPST